MVFARNIKAIREDSGLTQVEFGERLGVKKTSISKWEIGEIARPRPAMIELICHEYGVTLDDLFSENGYYAKTRGLADAKPKEATSNLPVVGAAHAGSPSPAFEVDGGRVECPEQYCRDGNFFVRISGDSMDRRLPDGSLALVDVHSEVHSGDIALVKVNGDDATVKVVKFMDGIAVLEPCSHNPEHHRMLIDRSNPESPEVRVLGKVVYAVISL